MASLVLHQADAAQSPSPAQLDAQLVPAAQPYGAHETGALATHCPIPLHEDAVAAPAEQLVAHGVFAAQREQLPAPSHAPLRPQDAGDSGAHSAPGSVPTATGSQAPSAPAPFSAAVHATHVPVQAVSQQTPSAQLPLWHSLAAPHASPSARFARQAPAAQKFPLKQSVSAPHGLVQALPTHRYGAQSTPPASSVQVPSPLHTRPFTALPTQLVAPHAVPDE